MPALAAATSTTPRAWPTESAMRASAPTYDSSSATASGTCSAMSAATASWIVFKRMTVSWPAGVDQQPWATSLRRPPLSWTTPYPQAAVPGSMPTTFTSDSYGPDRTIPVQALTRCRTTMQRPLWWEDAGPADLPRSAARDHAGGMTRAAGVPRSQSQRELLIERHVVDVSGERLLGYSPPNRVASTGADDGVACASGPERPRMAHADHERSERDGGINSFEHGFGHALQGDAVVVAHNADLSTGHVEDDRAEVVPGHVGVLLYHERRDPAA